MNSTELRLLQSRLQSMHVGYLTTASALLGAVDLTYTSRPPAFALEGVVAIVELATAKLDALNTDLEAVIRDVPADDVQREGRDHV